MSDMGTAQILFQLTYVLDIIRLRLQDRFGANDETALQIKVFTGRICLQQGKFREGVDIFKEIVEGKSRMMAEDHPSRLASQLFFPSNNVCPLTAVVQSLPITAPEGVRTCGKFHASDASEGGHLPAEGSVSQSFLLGNLYTSYGVFATAGTVVFPLSPPSEALVTASAQGQFEDRKTAPVKSGRRRRRLDPQKAKRAL